MPSRLSNCCRAQQRGMHILVVGALLITIYLLEEMRTFTCTFGLPCCLRPPCHLRPPRGLEPAQLNLYDPASSNRNAATPGRNIHFSRTLLLMPGYNVAARSGMLCHILDSCESRAIR